MNVFFFWKKFRSVFVKKKKGFDSLKKKLDMFCEQENLDLQRKNSDIFFKNKIRKKAFLEEELHS